MMAGDPVPAQGAHTGRADRGAAEAIDTSGTKPADVSAAKSANVTAAKSADVAATKATTAMASATTMPPAATATTTTRLYLSCHQGAGQRGGHQDSHYSSQHSFLPLCVVHLPEFGAVG
jgi:hypothetical protein